MTSLSQHLLAIVSKPATGLQSLTSHWQNRISQQAAHLDGIAGVTDGLSSDESADAVLQAAKILLQERVLLPSDQGYSAAIEKNWSEPPIADSWSRIVMADSKKGEILLASREMCHSASECSRSSASLEAHHNLSLKICH
jgi:hypothetical protein